MFTEDEIREQLEQFGYHNVPVERLKEFKRGNYLFKLLSFCKCSNRLTISVLVSHIHTFTTYHKHISTTFFS